MPTVSETPICVNCGASANKLYTIYDKDVIKLADCVACGKTVDKYVEYDFVLVFIDLILQYSAAYRHVFINTCYESYWRVIVVFTMFNAYNKWTEQKFAMHSDSKVVYELEWTFYKSLLESGIELLTYAIVAYLIAVYIFKYKIPNRQQFLSISLCGFYGNSLLVFSIIWLVHNQLQFVLAVHAFLFLSHVQVQRILCPRINDIKNVCVVLLATLTQQGAGRLSRYFMNSFN
ncbi:Protein ARV [Aphelenchoides besseyi]|nr:Protein ARV [Aphelenchoides besseyi]KAI6194203.1 Protein ARV [Aphelenchoides besseyi]